MSKMFKEIIHHQNHFEEVEDLDYMGAQNEEIQLMDVFYTVRTFQGHLVRSDWS